MSAPLLDQDAKADLDAYLKREYAESAAHLRRDAGRSHARPTGRRRWRSTCGAT